MSELNPLALLRRWAGERRAIVASLAIVLAMTCPSIVTATPVAAASDNDILAWGRNNYGQLGDGDTDNRTVPEPVSLPAGTTVKAIAGGYGFSLALTSTGQVLAWGDNSSGQLGNGTFTNSTVPVQVDLPAGTTVTAIATGDDHCLALTSTGQLLAWGYNQYGQLGNGANTDSPVPVQVALPAGTTATAVEAGAGHSLAVTSTGQVLAWGYNNTGQLGIGSNTDSNVPVQVPLPAGTTVTTVAGGSAHSLAVTSTGQVLAWGYNAYGQLGNGTTTTSTVPVLVHLPAGVAVTAIASGNGFTSLAITSAGGMLAWGDNSYGQLGNGTTTRSTVPIDVALPDGTTVVEIGGGDDYSMALTAAGRVLAWGYNRYGQLGDGTTNNSSLPVEVALPEGTTIDAIAGGSLHALAITEACGEPEEPEQPGTTEPEQPGTIAPVPRPACAEPHAKPRAVAVNSNAGGVGVHIGGHHRTASVHHGTTREVHRHRSGRHHR